MHRGQQGGMFDGEIRDCYGIQALVSVICQVNTFPPEHIKKHLN